MVVLNPNNKELSKREPRRGSNPKRPIKASMEEKPGGKCVIGLSLTSHASR